jgi:hypothetical protein
MYVNSPGGSVTAGNNSLPYLLSSIHLIHALVDPINKFLLFLLRDGHI